MTRALIVVGHELTSSEKAQDYRTYLRAKVGIRNVKVISGWNKTDDLLLTLVTSHAFMAGKTPFLLVYIGHGSEDGWAYGKYDATKWLELEYDRLADALSVTRKGPTLVINDCCHADGLTRAIVDRVAVDDGYGVIAASTEDGMAHGLLAESVLASWSDGKPYQPQVRSAGRGRKRVRETRWGAELDHYFFPMKP